MERPEASGVYLLPSLWSHGNVRDTGHPWGAGWWYNNAYKSVCSASDFFRTTSSNADTPQWAHQKNFYRYVIARWGYSRAVIGFVSMVELDGTSGYVTNSSQAVSWTIKVRDFFAANDPYRTNSLGQYPIGASKTDWDGTSTSWNGGDLFCIDSYRQESNDTEVAQAVGSQAASMRAAGRPAFHAEFGAKITGAAQPSQPAHLHNGIWAGAAAGGCISPLVWCDGGQFPMLTDAAVGEAMTAELEKLSNFVGGLGYFGAPGYANRTVTSGAGRGWGMGAGFQGFAWVQANSGTMAAKSFSIGSIIGSMSPGTYTVCWFDPWVSTTNAISIQTLTIGGSSLSLIAPAGVSRGDVVCKYSLNSAPVVTGTTATPNPVTGRITTLQTSGSDDASETSLVYTWSVVGTPPAAVTFSENGSNAAKNSIATFTRSGPYQFTVTATDSGGATSSGTVSVNVLQTPSSVTVVPASLTLPQGGTAQLSAQRIDQFAEGIAGGSFTWGASGGTIDASGLFTAGAEAGTFSIDATDTATALTGLATVTIIADAPPSIVAAAAANPSAVAGTSTALNVGADDNGGEAGLSYSWSYTSASGGAASFSLNDSNAAKDTVATFTKAGVYVFTVTVTDGVGLTTASSVDVTVTSTVTGPISVTPASQVLLAGSQKQYAAAAFDQFGQPMSGFAWSASAGSISTSGWFTAPGSAGAVTITASLNGSNGSTTATINSAPTIATAARATPSSFSLRTRKTSVLSVLGADNNGEGTLKYTWTKVSGPTGAAVTFSANGTNVAKNSTATFSVKGTYTFRVTVEDADGASVAAPDVTVTVNK